MSQHDHHTPDALHPLDPFALVLVRHMVVDARSIYRREGEASMNNLAVHFSSHTDKWNTPESVYKKLDEEFHFDFDPCPANYAPETLFSSPAADETARDGLLCEWGNRTFCNPPYSQIEKWIKKGYHEYRKGKTVVFLIPSRTDTGYWHNYIMKATEIRYIRGRLKFGKAKNSAPFPSAIVIFKHAQPVLWEATA